MRIFIPLIILFCITSYSDARGGPRDDIGQKRQDLEDLKAAENNTDTGVNTNASTNAVTVCGVVKEVRTSADNRKTVIFADGKSMRIKKSASDGLTMAIASMQNGSKFCCDATNAVCKTGFSLSK